jgi:choline transport protein
LGEQRCLLHHWLVNLLYSLGGLDGVSHITEEMPKPSRNAPLAVGMSNSAPYLQCCSQSNFDDTVITLTIAFVTGITYLITLMFSVQDWTALGNTSTGLVLAELFCQATLTVRGAFALTFMLWVALGPCMVGSQSSKGRVFWAFSRDEAMPFSKTRSKVNATLRMPAINTQLCVTAIVAALGCPYLVSSTAFNSLLGSAVTINNLAYFVPTLRNFVLQRKTMYPGAVHMGYVTGMIVNGITVCWLVFAIVFFSFPYYKPVTGKEVLPRNIPR